MSGKLIYDVGAYDGTDTAYYLSLGYNVLAIEADPALAERLRVKFCDAVRAGTLQVLHCGVTESDGERPFYICPKMQDWNSFDRNWATSRGMEVVEVSVPTRRFESILAEYGVPTFLKVDIEGLDGLCIKALNAQLAPRFVSFEASRKDIDLIVHLRAIGYQKFALIDQYTFHPVRIPAIGGVAHMKWSAMQAARQFSRKYSIFHRTVKAFKRKPDFSSPTDGFQQGLSAGEIPMLREDG